MRVWIRTLWGELEPKLWHTSEGRHQLQSHLNQYGFYVLTGFEDSLDIYAISDNTPIDVLACRRMIMGIEQAWNVIKQGKI